MIKLNFISVWRNFSSVSRAKPAKELKIINSHEIAGSKAEAEKANAVRLNQIKIYQREMAATRRSNSIFAQKFATRSEKEMKAKSERRDRKRAAWEGYLAGLRKCLNPPVAELQAAGKIPRSDPVKKAGKAERGRLRLLEALKQPCLMRRKYLNFLSTEVVPSLVTPANLDAKIQAALEAPVSHNLSADSVVQVEKDVRRKLKSIRIPMPEYEKEAEAAVNI